MFTGIVEAIGRVLERRERRALSRRAAAKSAKRLATGGPPPQASASLAGGEGGGSPSPLGNAFFSLTLEQEELAAELPVGGSVAVAGVCLTVTEKKPSGFSVDVANETARRSTLGRLRAGDRVNLERPLAANGRVDGHFVQGHVDGRGKVVAVEKRGADRFLRIEHPRGSDPFIVEKGSIAVDGVSLTVAGCGRGWFEVMLIPHTLRVTTLGELGSGDEVNLEYDILAKYLVRMASLRKIDE